MVAREVDAKLLLGFHLGVELLIDADGVRGEETGDEERVRCTLRCSGRIDRFRW